MYCRNPVADKVFALHDAPFRTGLISLFLIISRFLHRFCEFERNIQ